MTRQLSHAPHASAAGARQERRAPAPARSCPPHSPRPGEDHPVLATVVRPESGRVAANDLHRPYRDVTTAASPMRGHSIHTLPRVTVVTHTNTPRPASPHRDMSLAPPRHPHVLTAPSTQPPTWAMVHESQITASQSPRMHPNLMRHPQRLRMHLNDRGCTLNDEIHPQRPRIHPQLSGDPQ